MKKTLLLSSLALALASCATSQPEAITLPSTVTPTADGRVILGTVVLSAGPDANGDVEYKVKFTSSRMASQATTPINYGDVTFGGKMMANTLEDFERQTGTSEALGTGYRYFNSIFKIKVPSSGSVTYKNLTLYAWNVTANNVDNAGYYQTTGGSGIADIRSALQVSPAGADLNTATYARKIAPAHGMRLKAGGTGVEVDPNYANLQFFTKNQISSLETALNASPAKPVQGWSTNVDNLLPYGFVATNYNGSRTFAPGETGYFSATYRTPKTTNFGSLTPYYFTGYYMIVAETENHMTQSLEEINNASAVYQRRASLATTMNSSDIQFSRVNVLKDSAYKGADAVVFCDVRYAGSEAAPKAFLRGGFSTDPANATPLYPLNSADCDGTNGNK